MTPEEFVNSMTPEFIEAVQARIVPYEKYFDRSANKKSALRALYVETDELFTDIPEDIRKEIKCTKGCAHCCHIRAVATDLEAEVAIDYAKDNGVSIDVDRLKQQEDLTTDEYIFSPHKRCVFLQQDNTCGIYPVRPMTCRTYFVVNDPEWCDTTKYPKHEQSVVNNVPMAFPAMALLQHYPLKSFPKALLMQIKKQDNDE